MFDAAGYNHTVVTSQTKDGQVVGFCSPAGENQFVGLGSEIMGDEFAGIFDGFPRAPAIAVDTGSVAVLLAPVWLHRLAHFRQQRRSRVVVQINHDRFPKLCFSPLTCYAISADSSFPPALEEVIQCSNGQDCSNAHQER
ncbi:hypothetical protein HRbin36_00781 [bacterium HR36]|nr:hypothetical protein HRbin36_00781 [bacterium HR36]